MEYLQPKKETVMIIRKEKGVDVAEISRLQHAAFLNHPQHEPGAEPTEHLIVERLRQAGDLTLSLVAEDGGRLTGQIALSPARVGECVEGWLLLGPVGVLPELQGRGIGSALVREALQQARDAGASGVVLVGDPGFYSRLGFRSYEGLGYAGVPPMYVLGLPFGAGVPTGEITAHPAFR
jgi:putative acetyltransferase